MSLSFAWMSLHCVLSVQRPALPEKITCCWRRCAGHTRSTIATQASQLPSCGSMKKPACARAREVALALRLGHVRGRTRSGSTRTRERAHAQRAHTRAGAHSARARARAWGAGGQAVGGVWYSRRTIWCAPVRSKLKQQRCSRRITLGCRLCRPARGAREPTNLALRDGGAQHRAWPAMPHVGGPPASPSSPASSPPPAAATAAAAAAAERRRPAPAAFVGAAAGGASSSVS